MLHRKSGHSSTSIGNKLFVLARYFNDNCEVYDSITNKFTLLKTHPHLNNTDCYPIKTFAIIVGHKIYVFKDKEFLGRERKVLIFCYDVKENLWNSDDTCNIECIDGFSCAKMFKH